MARVKYSEDERLYALNALAEELGFEERNQFRVHELFICGPGRVFLNDWSALDAVNPSYLIHPVRGHAVQTDGWSWLSDDPAHRTWSKWTQRVNHYLDLHGADLAHVRDWLLTVATETAELHPWLRNVDDRGRPRKLMKCGSVRQLAKEADKWMRREPVAVVAQRKLGPEDIRWQADLHDGYYLVRLLSPEALDAETLALRHCVGRGSYDARLERDGYEYFSVRDGDGNPVATLEVVHDVLVQCRGYRNALPDTTTQAIVDIYVADCGLDTAERKRARENQDAAQLVGGLLNRRP